MLPPSVYYVDKMYYKSKDIKEQGYTYRVKRYCIYLSTFIYFNALCMYVYLSSM